MISSDKRDTEGDDINNIIAELDALRLEHQEAIRQLVRDAEAREARLLQQIQRAQAAAARRTQNNDLANPFSIGDTLRITNRLRNEQGINGVITHSGPRMVTIRNTRSRKNYTRAWWNLDRVADNLQ